MYIPKRKVVRTMVTEIDFRTVLQRRAYTTIRAVGE